MRTADLVVPAVDNLSLYGYAWLPDGDPKAVLLIAHGMAEHCRRYERFATALTAAGYAVYSYDHRGHGRTATQNDGEMLGHYGDSNGWRLVVTDLGTVREEVARRHPGLPIFLIGHSMGSLISRAYIQGHGAGLAGVILSGTAGDPGPIRLGGLALAKAEARLRGRRTLSPPSTSSPSARSTSRSRSTARPAPTSSGCRAITTRWTSTSRTPGVGSSATQFYADLFEGIAPIHNAKRVADVPNDLPLFLIAGSNDPVGDNWKGVLAAKRQFAGGGRPGCSLAAPRGSARDPQRDLPGRGHRRHHRLARRAHRLGSLSLHRRHLDPKRPPGRRCPPHRHTVTVSLT